MSYINDALKKAQKEKDNLYRHYEGIVSAPTYRKSGQKTKWMITTGLIVLILLALPVFSLLRYHILLSTDNNEVAVHQSVNMTPQENSRASSPGVKKLYQEALNYQRKNNLTRAEELYRKILNVDPEYIFALNNLGVIYMSQKRNEEAISIFKKAIDLKTDYVDPYYNLSCLYSRSGDIPRGLEYLKKAISINNNVKEWAKDDKDLQKLRGSSGFQGIVGEQDKASEEKFETYIVKEGDWIFDIIRKEFGASDEEIYNILKLIRCLNPALKDTNIVHPGQKLLLPKKREIEKNSLP